MAQLSYASDWKSTPFPGWNEDTILKLVTDSPWAKGKTVKFTWTRREYQDITYRDIPGADGKMPQNIGSPVGGIGGRPKDRLADKADILIRWASALPIRQAKALYKARDEKLEVSNATEPAPQDYVLEIFGLPVQVAHQGAQMVEVLATRSITLRTDSGRTLRPLRSEAKVEGDTLTVYVHFSRSSPLTAKDGDMECAGDMQVFEFRQRFRLAAMMYGGRLEI